jgi:hypothetical protein
MTGIEAGYETGRRMGEIQPERPNHCGAFSKRALLNKGKTTSAEAIKRKSR